MQGLCEYHEIIEQHGLSVKTRPRREFDTTFLPGLGYESGGYVPFLIESLSIHASAASFISSDAGSDAKWSPPNLSKKENSYLGKLPELAQLGCRQQMVME